MKKNKLLFSVIALALTVLLGYSCSDKFGLDDNKPDLKLNIPDQFLAVGEQHNEGLEHIYNKLSKIKDIKTRGGDNSIFEIIKEESVLFVLKTKTDKALQKENLHQIVNKTPLINTKQTRGNIINMGIFNDKQISFIDKYMTIVESLDGDIDKVIKKLLDLQNEVMSSCNDDESTPLLAAISVGCHSLQYWNENLYKWDLLNPDRVNMLNVNPKTKSDMVEVNASEEDWDWFLSTLTSMGQSDGIGAAIGAGFGAIAGGVGAIPGAIVGGCNASAGAGIKELFKRWGII